MAGIASSFSSASSFSDFSSGLGAFPSFCSPTRGAGAGGGGVERGMYRRLCNRLCCRRQPGFPLSSSAPPTGGTATGDRWLSPIAARRAPKKPPTYLQDFQFIHWSLL